MKRFSPLLCAGLLVTLSLPAAAQSLSLPGRLSRPDVSLFRVICSVAARDASRARAAMMIRPMIASAAVR